MCNCLFYPVAWIQAVDQVVLESVGIVDLEFSVTRGDRSFRTRAYSVTQDLSAEAGTFLCLCSIQSSLY